MPAIKAYLSPAEVADLVKHVAEHGSNYEKYQQWAERNGVEQQFTQNSLQNWIQRRRPQVIAEREKFEEEVRVESTMTRGQRLRMLEETLDRLHNIFMDPESGVEVEVLVKVAEQERKHMEAIAKDRGEFGKPPPTEEEMEERMAARGIGSEFDKLFREKKK